MTLSAKPRRARRHLACRALGALCTSAALYPVTLAAQQPVLEEIIVTAQK